MNVDFLHIEAQLLYAVLMVAVLITNKALFFKSLKYVCAIGCVAVCSSFFDILARFVAGNVLLTHIVSVLYLSCFGLVGCLWFMHCLDSFGFNSRLLKFLSVFPALAVIVTVLASVKNGWVYSVSVDGGFNRGCLYCVVYFNCIYAVMSFAAAVLAGKRTDNKRNARSYMITASFCIPVILSNVVSALWRDGISTFTYAVILSVLMITGDIQRRNMVTDNLTKLPNRYGMDDEIEEQLQQYRKDKSDSFYVIVCDMDNFKTINDTWGHPEGDRALMLIADALSSVAQQYNSEVFRFGGDEFIIITDTSEDGLAESVCAAVKEKLDAIDFRDDFDIRMSMGACLYDGSCTVPELIGNADMKLYQAKKNNKQTNN